MKTSEFKMRIKQLGYYLGTYDTHVEVRAGDTRFTPYAEIWNTKIGACKINTGNIELIKLCIEYVETPIEEREDTKKYIVILPDPNRVGKRVYVLGKSLGSVIIRNAQRHMLEGEDYHLTEAEIKRNHEYLWQFAKEVER